MKYNEANRHFSRLVGVEAKDHSLLMAVGLQKAFVGQVAPHTFVCAPIAIGDDATGFFTMPKEPAEGWYPPWDEHPVLEPVEQYTWIVVDGQNVLSSRQLVSELRGRP
jgi:hypothetical protein